MNGAGGIACALQPRTQGRSHHFRGVQSNRMPDNSRAFGSVCGARDTKLELFFGRFTENKPTERPSAPKSHQDTRNSEYLKKQVQKINQIASHQPYREGTHIWCKVLY